MAVAALAVSGAPRASAQPSPEWIRVAVVREDPEVSLQVQGRFTILTLQTGNLIQQGKRLPTVVVRAVPEGIAFGGEILRVGGLRVEPEPQATISLNGRRLRGALEIRRQRNQTLLVVNRVSLEDYLRGVLSKEAPDYWPPEVLKAIAIAARTYALYQRLTKASGDYDVTGDVMSQDYGGESGEKDATTRAVQSTAGVIILHRGRLFPTFYHSTCGGMTEHARVMGDYDLEPLRGGVACTFCSASPFFRWQRRLPKADIAWALRKSVHGSIGAISDFRVTKRTASGRAQEVTIVGERRTLRLTGFDLRSLLGFEHIRSPLFTVTPVADSFVLDGRGWGHGVGMCQWGAAELARRGFSAGEILAYYYPGIAPANLRDLVHQPIDVIGGTP
ncbi:MAG: SpoIID/LytB domain-containing protein [Candidatus Omnitrophica bacterium]|nr:SpoIID/LytB domain-containing protein [Candidatus Omnitrophota bacterium]